jgi:hypothetical protein
LASLSIETLLPLSVATLQMLANVTRESAPALYDEQGRSLLRGMHVSLVESAALHRAQSDDGAAPFVGSLLAGVRHAFGADESGVLSLDVRRLRLRLPISIVDIAQLNEFFARASTRRLLTLAHTQLDVALLLLCCGCANLFSTGNTSFSFLSIRSNSSKPTRNFRNCRRR